MATARRPARGWLLGACFAVDASCCGVDGFGEGGVDVDGPTDVIDGGSAGGSDDEFVDEVGGVGSDDGGTDQVPVGSGDDFDEAGGFADGTCLDDGAESLPPDHDLVAVASVCLGFG